MSTFPEPQIATDPERGARVARDDRAHVFHSWSAQALIDPMPIAGASGSHFWDFEGKRYLDFSSQLVNVNIGHQHPKLVAAIQEQAATLCTIAIATTGTVRPSETSRRRRSKPVSSAAGGAAGVATLAVYPVSPTRSTRSWSDTAAVATTCAFSVA